MKPTIPSLFMLVALAGACGSDDAAPAGAGAGGADAGASGGQAGVAGSTAHGGSAGTSDGGPQGGSAGAAGTGGVQPVDGGYIAPSPAEWVQDAHDAQRTGYTPIEPAAPWTFKWFWAPPVEVHESTMARGVHPVTGGSFVYMPAGNQGLFAIKKTDGTVGWSNTETSFEGAGAYDGSNLFIGGSDGKLYKFQAASGAVLGTYDAGSPIRHAVLLVEGAVYGTTDSGKLFKVDGSTMASSWATPYDAGSAATTPPSYSASRKIVIFGTQDLNVHAVNDADGVQKWKKNPTPFPSADCAPYSYEYVWPVVADGPGVVFVRLRLGDQNEWLWGGGGPNGRFATTNAEIRSYLEANPNVQALHALNLDDGSKKFTPAVGNGGVDCFWQNCSNEWVFRSTVGPMPAVRTLDGGRQVAYIVWRNGQVDDNGWDARWDSHLGEMVLDGETVPGYSAGDLRFLQADGSQSKITDEACPITFAGNTLFFAHWGASESFRIVDRSDSRGSELTSPITTERNHSVIRRIAGNGTADESTHWVDGYSNFYQDGRGYDGGNWWVYWNRWDPPVDGHDATGYQDNHYPNRPRYTIVSDGLVLVVGNGGDLFALSHGK
ncbi:MAG: PQQ-binding-like beta-propeller repeat protein [Deltaproteobacteria bacterium]|nr:PQQ-binding-like beta-propeller repeat protein [Deltaproteobacteria bacterium]